MYRRLRLRFGVSGRLVWFRGLVTRGVGSEGLVLGSMVGEFEKSVTVVIFGVATRFGCV